MSVFNTVNLTVTGQPTDKPTHGQSVADWSIRQNVVLNIWKNIIAPNVIFANSLMASWPVGNLTGHELVY